MPTIERLAASEIEPTLQSCGIPLEEWGVGPTKTIADLRDEIAAGNCTLEHGEGGLLRIVAAVGVNVYFSLDGTIYRLIEDRQVFYPNSPEESVRRRNLPKSIIEKMDHRDTQPIDGAIRALEEEMGIQASPDRLTDDGTEEVVVEESLSYPGLRSKYRRNDFSIQLLLDEFDPDGYVEHGNTKDTYFVWAPLEQEMTSE